MRVFQIPSLFLVLLLIQVLAPPALGRVPEHNLKCDSNFLKSLDGLFQEYLCLKGGGGSGDCEKLSLEAENLGGQSPRKINGGKRLKMSEIGSAGRKIQEYLKANSAMTAAGTGVGGVLKYAFRKMGGFYLDSIMNADSTANACESEFHDYKTKPTDKVDVAKFLMVGVPSGKSSCEMAFNIEGNKGLAQFYDLNTDKKRLKVLSHKTVCLYYVGIFERLEDLVFEARAQKSGTQKGAEGLAPKVTR